MTLTIYQVDSFAEQVFKGNPAAVCPLTTWLSDEVLLNIAAENNLSETAFYVVNKDQIEIRWFTPNIEVDLCGHATLAAAFVLHKYENFNGAIIPFFSSRSGHLPVTIHDDSYTLDFPVDQITPIAITEELISTTNMKPLSAFKGKTDFMLVFENEEQIKNLAPQLANIERLEARGLIVTAKGDACDFVSRFFGPRAGINEDPVTGSAHTTLTPYWSNQLNKKELHAEQISSRSGKLECKLENNRVEITGKAVLYLKGKISINHA